MGGSAAKGGSRAAQGGEARRKERGRAQGGKVGRKGGRPRKGGSDCTRYAVMIYCGPKAAFLMSFHTGRHFFAPRFRATIPHKRVN
jgi:hypothetical protein